MRVIRVMPSSRPHGLEVLYTDMSGNTRCPLQPGQDVYGTCGDAIQGLSFVVKDEAGRVKELDKEFATNMKVN